MELNSGTGNAPARHIYITEDEHEKCRKVADSQLIILAREAGT